MKEELSRLEALWLLLANDTKLSELVSCSDVEQFKRRARAEGMTFLTVTLPALGKSLDQSFLTGKLELPEGWKPASGCAYPSFLRKAWDLLFDEQGDPRWLVTSQPYNVVYAMCQDREMGSAVACIRQMTYLYYKYELPWSQQQEADALSSYLKAESEICEVKANILERGVSAKTFVAGVSLETILGRARKLLHRLLEDVDVRDIDPKYGTGATACRTTPWGRWQAPRFIPKLDKVYPMSEWFFSGENGLLDSVQEGTFAEEEDWFPTARMVFVAKDSRGPRTISAEPREFMYIQQGLMASIARRIGHFANIAAEVGLEDQTRNQFLAELASQTNHLVSGDLKEASDRNPWWLVQLLFPIDWVRAFDACRSEYTELPSGEVIPLSKFAPMGSAVCFPVEALVFWALAHAAQSDYAEGPLFKRLFDSRIDKNSIVPGFNSQGLITLSIFGDDIICRSSEWANVVATFEAVGLIVNRNKSFAEGPFRESCGGDFFLGTNVTPLRVKHRLEDDSVDCAFRFVTLCNSIEAKFGSSEPRLVHKLRELVTRFFGVTPPILPRNGEAVDAFVIYDATWGAYEPGHYPLPNKSRDSKGGGRWSAARTKVRKEQLNIRKPNYNRPELYTLVARPLEAYRKLGWCSVLRSFHVSGGRGGTHKYAIRRRVYYEPAWIQI